MVVIGSILKYFSHDMVSQAMMSVVGHEIPLGKSSEDQILRDRIFQMIAPYCLSTEDMEELDTFSKREMDVWLQSFTNTQKGVIFTSLLSNAKELFRKKYFPSTGACPASANAELLGLPAGHTILERLDIICSNAKSHEVMVLCLYQVALV
jgi:hypothetical protein